MISLPHKIDLPTFENCIYVIPMMDTPHNIGFATWKSEFLPRRTLEELTLFLNYFSTHFIPDVWSINHSIIFLSSNWALGNGNQACTRNRWLAKHWSARLSRKIASFEQIYTFLAAFPRITSHIKSPAL